MPRDLASKALTSGRYCLHTATPISLGGVSEAWWFVGDNRRRVMVGGSTAETH
jgi:hypothetical protein